MALNFPNNPVQDDIHIDSNRVTWKYNGEMWLRLAASIAHADTTGRDAADAHPTSAITGLDTALANTKDQGVRVKYIPASEWEVPDISGAVKSKVAIGAITFGTMQFNARVASKASCSIMLPKSWDAGNINLRFIWHVGTAVTGNVIMRHAYMPVIDGGTLGNAFGGAALATLSAPAAVDTINISGFSQSFKATGYFNIKGSLLNFHIYRDGTSVDDTFANSLYLLGIELQYTDDAKTDA